MTQLKDIFDIQYGNGLEFYKMVKHKDGVPFVSRTFKNNGIVGRVKKHSLIKPMPKNSISVAVSGSVLESFYHSEEYYTGFHVLCLTPKKNFTLNLNEMLFYCAVIRSNQYKYNYGRQANRTLKYLNIPHPDLIPKNIKEFKDYEKLVIGENLDLSNVNISNNNKKRFVNDIFLLKNGVASSQIKRYSMKKNQNYIPYIRPSKTQSTSIDAYVNKKEIEDKYIFPKNTLYVSTDGQGSHSYAYLSIFEFVPNSNVSVLIPKRNMSNLEKLFYSYCISKNRYKFSYGRKPKGIRLENILIPEYPNLIKNYKFKINKSLNL